MPTCTWRETLDASRVLQIQGTTCTSFPTSSMNQTDRQLSSHLNFLFAGHLALAGCSETSTSIRAPSHSRSCAVTCEGASSVEPMSIARATLQNLEPNTTSRPCQQGMREPRSRAVGGVSASISSPRWEQIAIHSRPLAGRSLGRRLPKQPFPKSRRRARDPTLNAGNSISTTDTCAIPWVSRVFALYVSVYGDWSLPWRVDRPTEEDVTRLLRALEQCQNCQDAAAGGVRTSIE